MVKLKNKKDFASTISLIAILSIPSLLGRGSLIAAFANSLKNTGFKPQVWVFESSHALYRNIAIIGGVVIGLGIIMLCFSLIILNKKRITNPKDRTKQKNLKKLSKIFANRGAAAILPGGVALGLSMFALRGNHRAIQGLNYAGAVTIVLLIIAVLGIALFFIVRAVRGRSGGELPQNRRVESRSDEKGRVEPGAQLPVEIVINNPTPANIEEPRVAPAKFKYPINQDLLGVDWSKKQFPFDKKIPMHGGTFILLKGENHTSVLKLEFDDYPHLSGTYKITDQAVHSDDHTIAPDSVFMSDKQDIACVFTKLGPLAFLSQGIRTYSTILKKAEELVRKIESRIGSFQQFRN